MCPSECPSVAPSKVSRSPEQDYVVLLKTYMQINEYLVIKIFFIKTPNMPAEPMTVLCEELVRLSLIIINPNGYGKVVYFRS